jgi:hypothetical protein
VFRRWADAGQKLLDFIYDRVWIPEDGKMVLAFQLDELRAGDHLSDGSPLGNIYDSITRAVQYKGRCLDVGQHCPHINLAQDLGELAPVAR